MFYEVESAQCAVHARSLGFNLLLPTAKFHHTIYTIFSDVTEFIWYIFDTESLTLIHTQAFSNWHLRIIFIFHFEFSVLRFRPNFGTNSEARRVGWSVSELLPLSTCHLKWNTCQIYNEIPNCECNWTFFWAKTGKCDLIELITFVTKFVECMRNFDYFMHLYETKQNDNRMTISITRIFKFEFNETFRVRWIDSVSPVSRVTNSSEFIIIRNLYELICRQLDAQLFVQNKKQKK